MINKPMLAHTVTKELSFPLLAAPKLDGIRCLEIENKALTRQFKPFPNKYVRAYLESLNTEGDLDGEIMGIDVLKPFNEISSDLNSYEGEPDFCYYVFDYVTDLNKPFSTRYKEAEAAIKALDNPRIKLVPHTLISSTEELSAFIKKCTDDGYEGTMVRKLGGPYKEGRSTEREGYLGKIKDFVDSEAVIVDVMELMHNNNPAEADAFGRTKRSSAKAHKTPAGTLGKLICKDLVTGVEFGLGTGYTALNRAYLWSIKDQLVGKIVRYKYQPAGLLIAPRFPVFLCFRSPLDL